MLHCRRPKTKEGAELQRTERILKNNGQALALQALGNQALQ
jgi:hypothetical protein